VGLLRLTSGARAKERRLEEILRRHAPGAVPFEDDVVDAQLMGSLELAEVPVTWEDVRASRAEGSSGPVARLRAARMAVDRGAPFDVAALLTWHRAVMGEPSALRARPWNPPWGTAASAPERVRERLEALEHWLGTESGRQLRGAERGALALARLSEIHPFDDANGRVSRLAASHLMVGAGARPPILVGGERPRLEECLRAAFRLDTGPLVALLEEASERALDVALESLRASGAR
jgi:hypothetical protein